MNCQVFRSPNQADTYLYLPEDADFAALPEALLQRFGQPEKVLDLVLDKDTRLARVEASVVMEQLTDQGFYLQLPPSLHQNRHNPWQ